MVISLPSISQEVKLNKAENAWKPGVKDPKVVEEYLGYDATIAFQGVGHSKAASRMLQSNLIGILPQEDRLNFT